MSDLSRQLQGYRLTLAEILYHLPDHPDLLQSFTWQTMDISPDYPVLRRFLTYWQQSLDGKLHSVRVAQHDLIGPARLRNAALFTLH